MPHPDPQHSHRAPRPCTAPSGAGARDASWRPCSAQIKPSWAPPRVPKGRAREPLRAAEPVPAWVTQARFEGHIIKGFKHGEGTYAYPNSFFRYCGNWVQNRKHGRGVLRLGDGTEYDGEWRGGEMTGYGRKRWPDGSFYEGRFAQGEPHGMSGVFIGVTGERYSGGWCRGWHDGPGRLLLPSGARYEGGFHRHAFEGAGEFTGADGSTFCGTWAGGDLGGGGEVELLQRLWTEAKGSRRATSCPVQALLCAVRDSPEALRALRVPQAAAAAALAALELRAALAEGDDTSVLRLLRLYPAVAQTEDARGAGPLAWCCEAAPRANVLSLAEQLCRGGAAAREQRGAVSARLAAGLPVHTALHAARRRDDSASPELLVLFRRCACVEEDEVRQLEQPPGEDDTPAFWTERLLCHLATLCAADCPEPRVTEAQCESIVNDAMPIGLTSEVSITLGNGARYRGGMQRGKRSGQGRQEWPPSCGVVYDGDWEADAPARPATHISLQSVAHEGRSVTSQPTAFQVRPSAAPLVLSVCTTRRAPGAPLSPRSPGLDASARPTSPVSKPATPAVRPGSPAARPADGPASAAGIQGERVTEERGRLFAARLLRPPPPAQPEAAAGKKPAAAAAVQLPLVLPAAPSGATQLQLCSAAGYPQQERRSSKRRSQGGPPEKMEEVRPVQGSGGAAEIRVWLPPGLTPGQYLLQVVDATPWPDRAAEARFGGVEPEQGMGPVHKQRPLRALPPPLAPLTPLVVGIEVPSK